MDSQRSSPRGISPKILKITAWGIWAVFLLATLGLFGFVLAMKADAYSARYYSHHSMNFPTVLTITYPVWIALLPFLGLPPVIFYQRSARPGFIALLLLSAVFFLVDLGVAILILFTGPPFQM